MISAAISAFAGFLTRPVGFLASNAVWIIGTALLWPFPGTINTLTYILSVEAIVIGSAVLVAGKRSELAMQAKLDELIKALPRARNEIAGIEVKTEEEIARLKGTASR